MSDEFQGPIPEAPFTLDELGGIERLLWGYGQYLQQSSRSDQNQQRIQTIEKIRGRLAAQLTAGDVKGVQVFLDVEDLQELLETMLHFATLVKRLFPQNEGREAVIEAVTVWRLRLIHIISEFDV